MTHRLTSIYAKNYCNRTLIVKVIVENVVTCFWGYSVERFRITEMTFKVSGNLTIRQSSNDFTLAVHCNSVCVCLAPIPRSAVVYELGIGLHDVA